VPLVVAGIGVAGTLTAGIAGGLITQRWANNREDEAWARERERELERWTREDEARTFEHRREVFEDFYQAVRALARRAYDHGYGFDGTPKLPFDWNADAGAKLNRLGLYADRRLAAAAAAAYNAAFWWCQHTKYDDPDDPEFYERQQRFDDAEYELLVLMRQALSIRRATSVCRSRATPTRLRTALMDVSVHNGLICAHECTPAKPGEFTPIRRSVIVRANYKWPLITLRDH
jgi:hypothetical protein